jgi:hypothetical protein
MTLPNFLVIGAGKAGTTSLYEYLGEHPQIFVSAIKETNFFAWHAKHPGARAWGGNPRRALPIRDLAAYTALFDDVGDETAIGEVSPLYLESLTAPASIRETLPDVKLIASLRQPVDRAYSGYAMEVRPDEVRPTLREAMRPESDLIQGGFYHALLQRYTALFPESQMLVILFEDLISQPLPTMSRIYRFLGVDPEFAPAVGVRHNPGGVPKNRLFDALLTARGLRPLLEPVVPNFLRRAAMKLRSRNIEKAPPLSPALHAELTELFREDILALQDFLGRDLSSWLAPRSPE